MSSFGHIICLILVDLVEPLPDCTNRFPFDQFLLSCLLSHSGSPEAESKGSLLCKWIGFPGSIFVFGKVSSLPPNVEGLGVNDR